MANNHVRAGIGNVEFLANQCEILELLDKGYTIISIYNKLKEEGKLSQSYTTFTTKIRQRKNSQRSKEKKKRKKSYKLYRFYSKKKPRSIAFYG